MSPFRSEKLDNGIRVDFVDQSNRYFGDYFRVCIEVRLQVPRPQGGEPLVKVRTLERMGVSGAEVETVRALLVDSYWQHAGRYLTHSAVPARLLAAEASAPRHRRVPGF